MAPQSKILAAFAMLSQTARAFRMTQRRIGGVQVRNYREAATDWIVLFKEGTSDSDIQSFCSGRCRFAGHPDKGGVPFAYMQVEGTHLESVLPKRTDNILLVEPDEMDYIIPEIAGPEAASAASWGLDSVGVFDRPGAGQGVHIFVQDTGIRATHEDFGGRVVPTLDLTSGKPVECGGEVGVCSGDRQGHGTHCAGSAAGETFGVASAATIHAVKTLSDYGSGARVWQMMAIDWTTVSGIKPAVLSMSLGGRGADPAYEVSIGAATEAGVTVVVAAGNSNRDSCGFSPAFTPTAITVGATTSGNERASYSNYGSCNNIMAPGSAIVSASSSGDTGSRSLSGTSMACPHVAGAAALVLEQDPTLKRDGVLAQMTSSGLTGVIGGLKASDPDLFLWVGQSPPAQ